MHTSRVRGIVPRRGQAPRGCWRVHGNGAWNLTVQEPPGISAGAIRPAAAASFHGRQRLVAATEDALIHCNADPTPFVLTRRLWLAIGINFAWNFTQSGIFGSNVSGISVGGLIESRLSGPELISGGAMGMEGSVFAIALCLAAGVVFLVQAHRAGNFIRPFWRRNN